MSLFAELGLRRYLNAEDTFTTNGASCMPPEVYRAMEEISGAWVDLEQMQRRVGEALAQCTRNKGAYVSAGTASALTLCAAAAICQGDPEAFLALPDASRCQRNELLVLSPQRNAYSLSLAASGARLRWAGQAGVPLTLAELEGAFTPRTAAVCYFVFHGAALCPPLESILAAAHARDIPVFVDAAAQLPPAENLWRFTEMGADLVIFSGGKGLAGPQDSGLVVGKRLWTQRLLALGAPHEGLCRGSKVTRETLAGLYAAVKLFLSVPEAQRQEQLLEKCRLARSVMTRCGFTDIRLVPKGPVGQDSPRVLGRPAGMRAQDLRQALREDGLLVGYDAAEDALSFHPQMLTLEQTWEACRILERRVLHGEEA